MQIKYLLVALVVFLLPPYGAVRESESGQAFELEADSVEYHYETGISTYRGDVTIRRGSLYLTGNVVEVTREKDDTVRIVVSGEPATFEDVLSEDGIIYIKAKEIDYDGRNRTIQMYGDVTVDYGGSVFRGSYIIYDMNKDIIRAPKQRRRIHLLIDPERITAP